MPNLSVMLVADCFLEGMGQNSYTDLESKARELYDTGYRPDDSLLGAIFGVDADADTKKKAYKDK